MSDEGPVLAATTWNDNARMIVDCNRLGYVIKADNVLDPTFGRGTWWRDWQPWWLTKHDLGLDGVDFRKLPHDDSSFDVVAFDPPYCAKGGRSTSGIVQMDERYGQVDAPATPALLQEMIDDGLDEVARVVKSGGIVLVKCMTYVSSGKLWLGAHRTLTHALSLDFELIDELLHVKKSAGPQPKRTRKGPVDAATGEATRIPSRQVHASRNVSTLFVLRAP